MKGNKKTIAILAFTLLLLTAAFAFKEIAGYLPEYSLLRIVLRVSRHFIHCGLLAVWIVDVYNRIIQKSVRRFLVAVGILMMFWLIVRTLKWDFIIVASDFSRYCWYAYYIPIVLIPLLGVFTVTYIGKPESYEKSKWTRLLYIFAAALIIAVFTNDFHEMVFAFPDGIENFDDYNYGMIYFVIAAWCICLGGYFIIGLMIKCKVPGERKYKALPAVIFAGIVIFSLLYSTNIVRTNVDFTAIDCIFTVAMIESCIHCGLIRSNSHYVDLFEVSRIKAFIVDNDYNVRYASDVSDSFSREIMEAAEQAPIAIGDYRLNSIPITGGHVLWQDDVAQINGIIRELKANEEQVNSKNALLHAEIEQKEKRAAVEEQTRIFEYFSREMGKRLDLLEDLLHETEENKNKPDITLAKICVIGAYIKRRGNLMLLGDRDSMIPARELEFCLRESLNNLQLNNAVISLHSECHRELPVKYAVAVYDIFEDVLEQGLGIINAMIINLKIDEAGLSMLIGIGGGSIRIPDSVYIETVGGEITFQQESKDTNISIIIPKGGIWT